MRTATGHSAFDIALQQVRSADVRPEFRLDEVPAPQRLAPDAVALTAERIDVEDESAYGRFVLLHDPDGVEEWEGTFRAVVFIRAELDSEVFDDPLIQDVAWSWLRDALATTDARAIQVGGTITRTSGKSFGTMEDRPADGFLEIRASWTPERFRTGHVVTDLARRGRSVAGVMCIRDRSGAPRSGLARIACTRRWSSAGT